MMSQNGSNCLREALYLPGVVARKHNPLLRQFAEHLLVTGMPKMAVTGAVMHKLVHLIYGVVRSGKSFDAHYMKPTLLIQDGI